MSSDLEIRCRALVAELALGRPEDVKSVVPLTGGVASDIARVDLAGHPICMKFALHRLRVAEAWFAPEHRNRAEYAWLVAAAQAAPGSTPRLLGQSDRLNGFAMEYIAGPEVTLWKTALLAEAPDRGEAAMVADVLGRIHAAGAAPRFDRAPFHNARDFHALRVEPYLLFTASRHAAVAPRLQSLAQGLDDSRVSLVHGDVSPKNILFRAGRPILLDAECATMGDPAFDVAFCLNHLILKSVHLPAALPGLRGAIRAFWSAYRPHVGWEDAGGLERRVAALLPALMLARIDGKSPVEYLSAGERVQVRAVSLPLIADPADSLDALLHRLDTTEDAA